MANSMIIAVPSGPQIVNQNTTKPLNLSFS
jgi:hypothetical protein